jgi:hypothetical protein
LTIHDGQTRLVLVDFILADFILADGDIHVGVIASLADVVGVLDPLTPLLLVVKLEQIVELQGLSARRRALPALLEFVTILTALEELAKCEPK